jgi:glyoxylase-like metal-dependent hydrolase (beta-lactamase superfamily II)
VRELRPGVWHWTAAHPEWDSSEPWGPEVSSYAVDDGERLLLFDPLAVPDELLDGDREVVIVLTAPWHERDAESLVERLGAKVFTAPRDSAQHLMEQFGLTAEQAGDGSPDILWLTDADKTGRPDGIDVFPGHKHNDLVYWIDGKRAVVVGDTLVDFGDGLHINERWLTGDMTRAQVVEGLRPLLDKPVELVLPAHGAPADRAALERALRA